MMNPLINAPLRKYTVIMLVLAGWLGYQSIATAQLLNDEPLNESQYALISDPFSVSTGDKIEVVELFWFGCGHCFTLEPHIKAWLNDKPENAEFVKVPALFSKRWEFHGQAFYTMKALNMPDQTYDEFFRAIHQKRQRINTLEALTKFLGDFDKTPQEVESAFHSFDVDTKMRFARKITRASGATGVPAILVDGKYRTSQGQAGGVENLFEVVNSLVAKAADER